jgi:hypothetical protein
MPAKMNKTSGIRVDFDLHGNATNAHTHDEWLASVFRRDGSFGIPGMLSHSNVKLAMYGAFFDELTKIAGALPPPLPAAAVAANAAKKVKPLSEMGQAFMHGAINSSLKPNANPFAHMKL